MRKGVLFLLMAVVWFSSCNRTPVCGIDGFYDASTLALKDSIVLEDRDILNPHHIYYKDGFLIFNSIRGEREIQSLPFPYVRDGYKRGGCCL